MSSGPVYLASDVHLGAVSRDRARAFVTWLEWAGARAGEVVINGDLFDFWFEYRHAIPRGHTRVLGALASLVDAGVPVRLMGGNHDWWGGDYLEGEIGLTFHREPVVVDLAGHRTFLAHGDGLGAGDLGYRMLKGVLRGSLTRWAFRWLHPDLGARVALRVSATEHRAEGPAAHDRDRAAALERWAVAHLEASPDLDLVVLGHTHIPALREVETGRWYLNAGDWVYHHSFAVLEPGEAPRLLDWTEVRGG
jgi:UDP-2,3-diacylglucosamine hydrolase